jgi:hypothetical protein
MQLLIKIKMKLPAGIFTHLILPSMSMLSGTPFPGTLNPQPIEFV